MVRVQSEVHLTTPVLSDPLMCVLRATHRANSHSLGCYTCMCMHAKFRGQSSPSASFLQLYVWVELQNAHVSAHSITDTELLGNIPVQLWVR